MSDWVIDTNVAIVANGRETDAPLTCQLAAIDLLLEVKEHQRAAIDTEDQIIAEYAGYMSYAGKPGTGDEFFRWLHDNKWNSTHCVRVQVTPRADDPADFVEFPSDYGNLAHFDLDDRVFVAVALTNEVDTFVAEATDTDWWEHRDDLRAVGAQIVFVCEDYIRELYER